MRIETTLLKSLIFNEDFARKSLPFLREEYYDGVDAKLFRIISDFYTKYNAPPTPEVVAIQVSESNLFRESEVSEAGQVLSEIVSLKDEAPNNQWLLDTTEKFCQEKALYNAIKKSIGIIDGKDKQLEKGSIPKILTEALAVCFDTSVGHDFIEDANLRYEFYHRVEERIPFDLEMLNKITKGGTPKKTLNVVMAGTGVGKTIFLCHHAASCLSANYNVLYITAEMSEERIAERIDANLLNVSLDDLKLIPKSDYDRKIGKLKSAVTKGKLIIKEYPTAAANVMHFKHLLDELALKKNFRPDIIFIDYLNICSSFRIKPGANVNSYSYIKSIAEEIRGLAVEYNVPIWTATQVNRGGFDNSDPDLTDTSESFGLPMTVDFMFVLVASEAMNSLQQIMVKQLKNRYDDENKNKKFVLGLDKNKMRFSNVAADEQNITIQKISESEEMPWRVDEKTHKTVFDKEVVGKFVY